MSEHYPHIEDGVDYARYQAAVAHELEGLEHVSTGTCPDCPDCEDIGEDEREGFRWSACDACGRALGGDRHPAHGLADGQVLHLSVCTDCLYYLEYGHLDESCRMC